MRLLLSMLTAVILLSTVSCTTQKPIQYLEPNADSIPDKIMFMEPLIQAGDLLSIVVYSDDPAASAVYNQASSAIISSTSINAAVPQGTAGTTGYLVDGEGLIIIPNIGPFKVGGHTKKQVADSLVSYFVRNDVLKNPSVDIRFLNYRVTLLGEVARPGVYTVPVEKVSVLEALGLAGDVTIWAKRDNVTIIREVDGKREFGRLDLTQSNIFESPYFYLKQNDIVVVGQSKRKLSSTDQTTWRLVTITTSIISAVAIIVNLATK